MRVFLIAVTLATASPAIADDFLKGTDAAARIGLIEWAKEHCDIQTDPARVKPVLEMVYRTNTATWVMARKMELDKSLKAHGKDVACHAAAGALKKLGLQ